jgi:hypothetical protein
MRFRDESSTPDDLRAAQQRQQVGAALWLGLIVLVLIVWRAAAHDLFRPGWWQIW